MPYAICRTDRMAGTTVPSMLVSARYMPSDTATAIENGNVIELKGLIEGERELFKGDTPAGASKVADCVLVCTPEVMYDERKKNLNEFRNEAGENLRCYRFHSGDVFSVTREALTGSPAKDSEVALAAGTKLEVAGAGTKVGKIIEEDGDYYVILVY